MEGQIRARSTEPRTTCRARSDGARSGEVGAGERGEMLIETLITITLVGLGVVAIVAALGSLINWSTGDRTTTKTEALLWSYGEALSQVPYEPCSVGGARPYLAAAESALPAALPDGTTAVRPGSGDGTAATVVLTVTTVQYWDKATNPATYVATCQSPDGGAQALTLTATAGDGSVTRTLTIYKRLS